MKDYEVNLHHAHVQSRVNSQLLSYVSCRFSTVRVGLLESLQLLSAYGRTWSFVAVVLF